MYQTFDFHNISKVNTKKCFLSDWKCDETLSIQLRLKDPFIFVKCLLSLQVAQKLCISKPNLTIVTLAAVNCNQENNQLALKKRNKIDQNLLITTHRQYILVEVNFCFLKVPPTWLTAVKHKAIDYESWHVIERYSDNLLYNSVIILCILNNVLNLCEFGLDRT